MGVRFAAERENNKEVFYKEYTNDYCYPHFHSHIELYFVTDGEMEISVGHHSRTLGKNQLAVSFSFETHRYITPTYSKSAVFIIPLHVATEIEQSTKNKTAVCPFITDETTVKNLIDLIKKYNNSELNQLEKTGYLCLIAGIVCKSTGMICTVGESSAELSKKILFYISRHFTEDISLETLAHHLGYSYTYISAYFKNCFHISFNKYLNFMRLAKANEIMTNSSQSITYAAMESGFTSMRSFYRAFRSEFGISPKEWLKNQLL